MLKPLLKWAGGKRQLLPELARYVPPVEGTYFEPFFGGGALFFHLREMHLISSAVLADRNCSLHNFYTVVKENPEGLISALDSLGLSNIAEDYYTARERFNRLPSQKDPVMKAALLLYLNRHCYNGLFRVNSRGEFNVPFGRYTNPSLPEPTLIMNVSSALEKTVLVNADFEETLADAADGDFVYLDPPYYPVDGTFGFTHYDLSGFGFSEQVRLARVVEDLDSRGVNFTVSNSADQVIRELYSNFKVETVPAKRAINSRGTGRGRVEEIIVTNH